MDIQSSELPTRHISIRVPWHDTAWDGRICEHPSGNASCLVLDNIHKYRDDEREDELSGRDWDELDLDDRPPCVVERAGFMRSEPSFRFSTAPYEHNEAHSHIAPTRLDLPPYAAMAVPFRWMLRSDVYDLADRHGFVVNQELEEQADRALEFEADWLQQSPNQRAALDTFFSAIRPGKSLVFFYAKDVPLVESSPGERILIGAGRVQAVGEPTQYDFEGRGELEPWLWDRAIHHSVRPDFSDGFLLPYHDLLKTYPERDLSEFVAYAPEGHWGEFSYASEHVRHDGAIASLLNLVTAVKKCRGEVEGPWNEVLTWLDARLNDTWELRGPYPGLGSALSAFGIEQGTLLAHRIKSESSPSDDLWAVTEGAFEEARSGQGSHSDLITRQQAEAFSRLMDAEDQGGHDRMRLLRLLSRFELTADQATRFYQVSKREAAAINLDDEEILRNPYLVYELDRAQEDPIEVETVDRGLLASEQIRAEHPLPIDQPVEDATDPRRVRALVVSILEAAADQGDTLLPARDLVSAVQGSSVTPACPLTEDLLPIVKDAFEPTVQEVSLDSGLCAFQLQRLAECRDVIRRTVSKRVKGRRHQVSADWRAMLDKEFETSIDELAEGEQELEELARDEKAAALQEMASSRLSVLAGPAGTGKTTLLKVLTQESSVSSGGVLLMAPTGKARVQLQQLTELNAQTIAQFLLRYDRYDPQTGAYRIRPESDRYEGAKTVIIDEASMLTEEQLAATIDALRGVERIVLVGDTRQLPPIGSGRPFVDIVRHLAPDGIENRQVRVGEGSGYCELTVHRRQIGEDRPDLELAEWFARDSGSSVSDEIWSRLLAGETVDHLELMQWDGEEELHQLLLDVIVQELELAGTDDSVGFAKAHGANISDRGYPYFHRGIAQEHANRWQILTPLNKRPSGVRAVNRLIKTTFRARMREFALDRYKIPRPFGTDEIVYGDKVINVQNSERRYWDGEGAQGYVANGEIGLVVGQFKSKGGRPKNLNVEFSSQPGRSYTYRKNDFREDGDYLELAYAVTIHKSQGSQFGTTILVLPDVGSFLSPELLYTGLTRQQDKVVILHQGDLADLRTLSSPSRSETASRLTNLFEDPAPAPTAVSREDEPRLLDEHLIHKTSQGEVVRSKSEVIIANLLYEKGIDYRYEEPFTGDDGRTVFPDFTYEDAATGELVIWEHLGLLHTADYRRKWQKKKKWYQANGIIEDPDDEGRGRLVTSRDDERGGIDAEEINRRIAEVFT